MYIRAIKSELCCFFSRLGPAISYMQNLLGSVRVHNCSSQHAMKHIEHRAVDTADSRHPL